MLTATHSSWLAGALLLAMAGCSEERTTPAAEPKPGAVSSTSIAPSAAPSPAASLPPTEAPTEAPLASASVEAPASSSSSPTAKNSAAPKTAPSAAPTGPVVGETSSVTATAKVDAPYHCNEKYPTKFVTAGGSNVSYPSAKVAGGCSGASVASATIPFVPTAAGAGTVQGKLKYGICDADDCKIVEKDVTLPFTAAAK